MTLIGYFKQLWALNPRKLGYLGGWIVGLGTGMGLVIWGIETQERGYNLLWYFQIPGFLVASAIAVGLFYFFQDSTPEGAP